ncbi:MAG TPA: uroporphyrinogen-III synthase [Acidisoma sp.]|uniref:uroporphyrinogen-III synthase n=1 Tax=Acidisoma sp. TaxID=1872115 RepID=UPI002B920EBC|nr:uroporphyrinogen-III synthase [Acidisoma sp.]HTI02351.1 uroporphyrinogen-III synthase [Acidisoma sp.]
MAMQPMPVLVTRPEPGASSTARHLAKMGFAPIVAPLLTIRTFVRALPGPETLRGIVVASRQAIPALPDLYHDLPLYAVGDATAAEAREAGFRTVVSAQGRAEDLARLIIDTLPKEGLPLLLATGFNQGDRLKRILQAFGFEVLREEVYAAHSVTTLPPAAADIIGNGGPGWVLLFSRETALCLGRLSRAMNLVDGFAHLGLAAISPSVADAVGDLPWARIRVAMDPNEKAVLALLND